MPQALDSSPAQTLLRKLDVMEQELSHHQTYTGSARWMIPYADLLTILLGFFVVLFALNQLDQQSLKKQMDVLQGVMHQKDQIIAKQKSELQKLRETLQKLQGLPILPEEVEVKDPEDQALQQALDQKLASKQGIRVRYEERGIVISLMESVLFAPGEAQLTPSAKKTLDGLAQVLKGLRRSVRVEGHTDNTPIATSQYPSNWELSTARATGIVKYLVDTHRFDPYQLSAAGYGEYRPLMQNSSIEGKQKNRRVDIVILNTQTAQQEPEDYSSRSQASGPPAQANF